jgi:acetyl esterase
MSNASLSLTAVEDALRQLGLPFAWHRPASPAKGNGLLALLLHPGSFNSGCVEDAESLGRVLAAEGVTSLAIGYPLAPAHPFPQALDAAWRALQLLWRHRKGLAGRSTRLLVVGMSAGGNLAAALALRARDEGEVQLAAQWLFGPALDPLMATASLREAKAGMCDCPLGQGWKDYLDGAHDHPYAAPLQASRLAGVAPALIVAADDEPLRDDAALYAERLRAAAVSVAYHRLPADGSWAVRARVAAHLDGGMPSAEQVADAWAPAALLVRSWMQLLQSRGASP